MPVGREQRTFTEVLVHLVVLLEALELLGAKRNYQNHVRISIL